MAANDNFSEEYLDQLREYNQLVIDAESGNKRLSASMRKQLKQAHTELQKAIKKTRSELARLEVERIKALKNGLKGTEEQINKDIHAYTMLESRLKESSVKTKEVSRSMLLNIAVSKTQEDRIKSKINTIKQEISLLGALTLAWNGMNKVWDFWAAKEKAFQTASRQMVQRTGATGVALNQLNRETQQLADRLAALSGDPVEAIAQAQEAISSLHTSLRRGAGAIDKDFRVQLEELIIGLQLSGEEAAAFGMAVRSGFAPGDSVASAYENIADLASDIGANAGQLTREFIGARKNIAQFGRDGGIAFRNAAMMATEFQVEVKQIFDMAAQFDTFEKASDSMNTFNSMMGTSISSFELMMEQDPAARIEMLREQLRGAGLEWGRMDRQQKQMLAQITGQDEDALSRIFGDGASLQELQQEQEVAAKQRDAEQRLQMENQTELNKLFTAASTHFQTWEHWMNMIKDAFADLFGGSFKDFNDMITQIIHKFTKWIRNSGELKTIVRDVTEFIKSGIGVLENLDWAGIKQTAIGIWDVFKGIAETLKPVIDFLKENPRVAVGAGIGAAALGAGASAAAGVMGAIAPIMAVTKLASLAGAAAAPTAMVAPGAAAAGTGLLGTAAGMVAPAAIGLGIGAGAGHMANTRRDEEGARVAAGDVSTRRQLSGTALETLRSRADLFSSGRTELAMQGVGSRGAEAQVLNLLEGLGIHSGQEADQKRNNMEYLIKDYIKGGIRPQDAIRNLSQILPLEMRQMLAHRKGQNFESYIMDLYRQDPHLSSMFMGSLNADVPKNASSASIPVASATKTSAPVSQSTAQSPTKEIASNNVQAQVTMANVYLDSALVGRAQANLAIGGRTA